MEDIARDAGVSIATAYGHYSKDTLIGHVYAPLLEPLIDQAENDVSTGQDPGRALTRHVKDLMQIVYQNRNLSIALLHALEFRALTGGGPPRSGDMSDVRILVPAPQPMTRLIEYGQRAGAFTAYPAANDVAIYHTNAAFLQLVTRPRQGHRVAARVVLSQLIPALRSARPAVD